MFVWNGETSQSWDIICEKMPSIELPAEEIEEVEVDGKSGFYTINTGVYKGTTKEIVAHYEGENFDGLSSWLDGSGEVIFDIFPDRYYKAYIKNSIPLDSILRNKLSKFPIVFQCQPFGYSLENSTIKIDRKNSNIINNYTYFSEPIITVYGNGNIELFIGDQQISLKEIDEKITINSELKEVYKDLDKLGEKMIGDYPILKVGKTNITWEGSLEKIEIIPNWRFKL